MLILERLLGDYERLGREMYEQSQYDHSETYKKLFTEWRRLVQELDSLGPNARLRLKPFLHAANLQLRLNAAYDVYDLDPEAALVAFRAIHNSGTPPQCMDAFIALRRRDPNFTD